VEIKFINVNYNTKLHDVSFTFNENQIHGIAGVHGSGKTAILELIDALIFPDLGEIKINNKDLSNINNLNLYRKKIGLVFQNPEEQFFCSTVKEEIEFGLKYHKKERKDNIKHIKEALIMVGLDESYLLKDPFSLSSGEKRRVAIASVLAFNPKVIMFDEPTITLDEKSKDSLIKIIKMLKNKYNKTIIISTTDTDLLHKLCDHVIVLKDGYKVMDGTKYEVFTQDIENYGLKKPKIIEFEQLVLKEKNIKIGYRDDINDLMKDIYRYVK